MSRFANPSLRKTRTKNFGLIGRSFLCRTRPRIYFTANKSVNFLTAANTKKRLKFQPLIKPRSGKRGIRTPGTLQFNGFQDRRNRPLCHLSGDKSNTDFRYCQILAALNSRLSGLAPQRTDGRQALPGPSGQRIRPERPFNFRLWVFGIPKFA